MKLELHAGSRIGQLYVSSDPGDNAPASLHLINTGAPVTLTPPDGSGIGTCLNLSFTGNLVPVASLGSLMVSSKGWTCVVPKGSSAIVMTPDAPVPIATNGEIVFTLELPAPHASGKAHATISDLNKGPLRIATVTAEVSIGTKPQADLAVSVMTDSIFVTRVGEKELANTIEFAIQMSATMPVPDPKAPPPVFTLYFDYGDSDGSLTTNDRAKKAELVQIGNPAWSKIVNPKPGPDAAAWTLLPGNNSLLGPGAAATFRLSNVVSQIAADRTQFPPHRVAMYLKYSGVFGLADGVKTISLWKKLAAPSILHFWADRLEVDAGQTVNLSWATFGVDRLALHYTRYFDGVERDAWLPAYGDDPLPLSPDAYPVFPTMSSDFTLYAYAGDGTDPVASAAVSVSAHWPAFKDDANFASPAYDGDVAVVTWQAYHADGVTVIDSVTNTGTEVRQPRSTLSAVCNVADSTISVVPSADFPIGNGFDIQVDQEIMKVIGRPNVTQWNVQRDPMEREWHDAGTAVVGAMSSATVPVQRGKTQCTVQAWKEMDPSVAGVERFVTTLNPPIDVLIKPRLTNVKAEPSVVPVAGGNVQVSWVCDDPAAKISTPSGTLGASPATVAATGPAFLTLKSATGTGSKHVEDAVSLSIGRYRVSAILLPGGAAIGMSMSADRSRMYILNTGLTFTVVDLVKGAVLAQTAIPSRFPLPGTNPPVNAVTSPKGFSPQFYPNAPPLGLVVNGEDSQSTWYGGAPQTLISGALLAIDMEQHTIASTYSLSNVIYMCERAFRSDGPNLNPQGLPESAAPAMRESGTKRAYMLSAAGDQLLIVDYEFP